MRVVVCDDDPVTRSVLTDHLNGRGDSVIAVTDSGMDAVELIARFSPDALVLDGALAVGSGEDVLEELRDRGLTCGVVVFTAYPDAYWRRAAPNVQVVEKPDFGGVERALDALATPPDSPGDRRHSTMRQVDGPTLRRSDGADDPAEFYSLVADARAGDVLIALSTEGVEGVDAADLVAAARRAIRVQDRLLRRGEQVLLFLVNGGSTGRDSVVARVQAQLGPSWVGSTIGSVVVEEPDDASEALRRLTHV